MQLLVAFNVLFLSSLESSLKTANLKLSSQYINQQISNMYIKQSG